MNWIPIESAPKNIPLLLRYFKNGKSWRTRVTGAYVVTQAKALPLYKFERVEGAYNNGVPSTFYRTDSTGYNSDWVVTLSEFVMWVDHLDRLIVDMSSYKEGKNKPCHWLPMPPDPE